jgi:hypothetical protein
MIANDPLAAGIESGCSPSERKSARRYQLEIAAALVLYVATLLPSLSYVEHLEGPLRILVAVLPMAGFSAIIVAFVRFALRMDEFQRQTLVVSGAIAALGCAFVTMTLGFLENAGFPRISMVFVWPIMALAFGVALPFVRRHFR